MRNDSGISWISNKALRYKQALTQYCIYRSENELHCEFCPAVNSPLCFSEVIWNDTKRIKREWERVFGDTLDGYFSIEQDSGDESDP